MRRLNNSKKGGAVVKAAICAALASAAGGCDDYLDRSDTITLGVGDATDGNKAIQTINRWPDASRQDRWRSDGERARSAIARYRLNKVTPPKALTNKVGETSSETAAVTDTPVTGGPPADK